MVFESAMLLNRSRPFDGIARRVAEAVAEPGGGGGRSVGRGIEPLAQVPPPMVGELPGHEIGPERARVAALYVCDVGSKPGEIQPPVAKLKLPETEKPSRMCERHAGRDPQFVFAKGQLEEIGAGHLVANVEDRVAFLRGNILPVLHHASPSFRLRSWRRRWRDRTGNWRPGRRRAAAACSHAPWPGVIL